MITQKPSFRACLFDLDGTLVDSLPGIAHSFSIAMREVMPHLPVPDIGPLIGPPIRDICRQALVGKVVSSELDALEAVFRRDYDSDGWLLTVPYPGVLDNLPHIASAGVECYIVTNKPVLPTARILLRLGLDKIFQEVVTRDTRNPNFASKTEATLDLANRLRWQTEQIAFLGDSLDDAEAANACGFRFIAADYGFGQVSTRAPNFVHHRCPNFTDVVPLLASSPL
jgi:phosphoglycolate phosphatase